MSDSLIETVGLWLVKFTALGLIVWIILFAMINY